LFFAYAGNDGINTSIEIKKDTILKKRHIPINVKLIMSVLSLVSNNF